MIEIVYKFLQGIKMDFKLRFNFCVFFGELVYVENFKGD